MANQDYGFNPIGRAEVDAGTTPLGRGGAEVGVRDTGGTPTTQTDDVERKFQERVLVAVSKVTGVKDPEALGEMGKGVMFRILDTSSVKGYVPNIGELNTMPDGVLIGYVNEAGANNYFNPGYIKEREKEFMSRVPQSQSGQNQRGGVSTPSYQFSPYTPDQQANAMQQYRLGERGGYVPNTVQFTGVGGASAPQGYAPQFGGSSGFGGGDASGFGGANGAYQPNANNYARVFNTARNIVPFWK